MQHRKCKYVQKKKHLGAYLLHCRYAVMIAYSEFRVMIGYAKL